MIEKRFVVVTVEDVVLAEMLESEESFRVILFISNMIEPLDDDDDERDVEQEL
jgi:hypothetical protein